MSQENVELAHRAYEALQPDDIDGFLTYVLWQLAELKDGRIVWYRAFRTEEEALEAVKLRE
jgi:hypothetical protein